MLEPTIAWDVAAKFDVAEDVDESLDDGVKLDEDESTTFSDTASTTSSDAADELVERPVDKNNDEICKLICHDGYEEVEIGANEMETLDQESAGKEDVHPNNDMTVEDIEDAENDDDDDDDDESSPDRIENVDEDVGSQEVVASHVGFLASTNEQDSFASDLDAKLDHLFHGRFCGSDFAENVEDVISVNGEIGGSEIFETLEDERKGGLTAPVTPPVTRQVAFPVARRVTRDDIDASEERVEKETEEIDEAFQEVYDVDGIFLPCYGNDFEGDDDVLALGDVSELVEEVENCIGKTR